MKGIVPPMTPVFALLVATTVCGQEVGYGARAEAWVARASGTMKFDEKPAVGDRTDLAGDLGADDFLAPLLDFDVTLGANRFDVAFERITFRSEETLDRARRWNESLFAAGEEVDTRFDLIAASLGYERTLLDDGRFSLRVGAVARYLRLEVVLSSASQGRDDDHIVTFTPALDLHALWSPHPDVALEVGIEPMLFHTGDIDVRGVTAELRAAWKPVPWIAISVGYRVESIRLTKDIEIEQNDLSGRFDGLTFGFDLAL